MIPQARCPERVVFPRRPLLVDGVVWVAVMALAAACAGPRLVARANGFENAAVGYWIAEPAQGGAWQRIAVKGTDLAFSRRGSTGKATMTLQSDCRESEAPAEIRARNLLIGVGPRKIHRSGPMALGRDQGWAQTFDLDAAGRPLRVKTVTLVSGGCTFDWVLLSPGPLHDVEEIFDSWWSSFQRVGIDRSSIADARRPT